VSDGLAGVDDAIAVLALVRRARERQLVDGTLCGQRFTHPRQPIQVDTHGYRETDVCACLRPTGHDGGCVCEHDIERRVYRVDDDGRALRDATARRNTVNVRTARVR